MNGACNVKLFLACPPGALGRGQQVKYHLISITKPISKIFIPNFVCVLTNERYKTYQTGFYIVSTGKHIEQNFHSVAEVMPQGWDLGVLGGSKTLAWGFAMELHGMRILVYFLNHFVHIVIKDFCQFAVHCHILNNNIVINWFKAPIATGS